MRFTPSKVSWGRLGLIVAGSTVLLVMTSHLVKSNNNTSEIFIPKQHETGHVHDHQNRPWPPSPDNISDVVDLSKPGEDQSRQIKRKKSFDDLERNFSNHAAFKAALGRKFTRIDVSNDNNNEQSPVHKKYTYFSRDKNSTVEVETQSSGASSIKSIPASEYQPEITDEETEEAIQLARQYFLDQGKSRVNDLKGFGILAYSPNGKGFYSERVIYISFHADEDAPPEFMAWVNLTTGTILKSREEN